MALTKLKIGIIGALVAVIAVTTTIETVKHFAKAHGSLEISITNHSSLIISNLAVNSDHYGVVGLIMPPGSSARMLYPSDSPGWLYFEANGQKIESRGKNYKGYVTFTSGQSLSFEIGPDLKVTASNGR